MILDKAKKILVLGGGDYALPFLKFGRVASIPPFRVDTEKIKEYDLIVFTGGSDVHPSLYNQDSHITTMSNLDRDKVEEKIFKEAKKKRIPMVGICRGAQFLTVMNGGGLIQNVERHKRDHFIYTDEGAIMNVTSTHHQMMQPDWKNSKLVAWSQGLSGKYEGDGIVEKGGKNWPGFDHALGRPFCLKEPEIVWYEEGKSLAVQYHPEYMQEDTLGFLYFQRLVNDYLLN